MALDARPIRWLRSRLGATYHHLVLGRHPRVLCNSIPKSGTNLVVGLVEALPWIRNHHRGVTWHHVPRSLVDQDARPTTHTVRDELSVCLPGEVFLGHVEADPDLTGFVASRFRALFVYRDPRDVVTSLLHWWSRDPSTTWDEPDSWPFRYFHTLESDSDRLTFLIDGWPAEVPSGFPADVAFPDIGARTRAFTPWLADPSCLPLRFEELRDPATSADLHRAIVRHLYPTASPRRVERLAGAMSVGDDPSRSKTYRSGRSGGWRRSFEDRHVAAFKRHAGDLLIELGYETDRSWGLG